MNKSQLLSFIREKVGQNEFARCVEGVSLSIGGIRFVVDEVTREKAYVTLTSPRTGTSVLRILERGPRICLRKRKVVLRLGTLRGRRKRSH